MKVSVRRNASMLAVLAMTVSVGSCGKKKDDATPAKKTVTPTVDTVVKAGDMTGLTLAADVAAVFPSGNLTMALVTYPTPCNDGDGPTTGPNDGTVQCAVARLLADPAVYNNVGQGGFLESIYMFGKAFKLSLKDCTAPFTGAARNVIIPIVGTTVEMACGRTPPNTEIIADIKAAGLGNFSSMTDEKLAAWSAGATVSLVWGANDLTKNILALMDMPAKTGDKPAPAEQDAWWYSTDVATGALTLQGVNYQGGLANRRFLTGNPTTHTFNLNYRWQNPDTTYYSMRGAGYSEGAGKYYLIQAISKGALVDNAHSNASLTETTPLSFCFKADTKTLVHGTQCDDLTAQVEAISFFTAAQLATAAADITVPKY